MRIALHNEGKVGNHACNGRDSREDRRRYHPNRGNGKRNLQKGVTLLVLHDNAAHVALVDQFLDLGGKILAVYLELLEEIAELVHAMIISRCARRHGATKFSLAAAGFSLSIIT